MPRSCLLQPGTFAEGDLCVCWAVRRWPTWRRSPGTVSASSEHSSLTLKFMTVRIKDPRSVVHQRG